jgi:hypothetical protein
MNAVTVVLLVLAIHFGGADIDTARSGTARWFSESELRETWDLLPDARGTGRSRQVPFPGSVRTDGLYLFGSDTGTERIAVQRLVTPNLTFAVTRSDAAGTVSFVASVAVGHGADSGGSGETVSPADVLVGFAQRGEDLPDTSGSDTDSDAGSYNGGGSGQGSPSPSADSDAAGGPAPGVYRIDRSDGTVSVSDPASGQIVLLTYR